MTMKPSHRVPTIRTSGFSRAFRSVFSCHLDFFNMSIPCFPSIPCPFLEIPPFVLFAIWRRNAHLRVSSRQNCIVVRSTHVSSKHDCAPQTRITWLEGRENHFMGIRAKIYSSCLEVLLLHRLDDVDRVTHFCVYAADSRNLCNAFVFRRKMTDCNKKTWRKLENF